ncbi:hypothetical protein D3C76_1274630 [compost metagenome]
MIAMIEKTTTDSMPAKLSSNPLAFTSLKLIKKTESARKIAPANLKSNAEKKVFCSACKLLGGTSNDNR